MVLVVVVVVVVVVALWWWCWWWASWGSLTSDFVFHVLPLRLPLLHCTLSFKDVKLVK